MEIEKLDKNFRVNSVLGIEGLIYRSAQSAPFAIYGFADSEKYLRMPENIARNVSDGVYELAHHTAGGRITFATDSDYVAVNVGMKSNGIMPHMTVLGISGFDIYVKKDGRYRYCGSLVPPAEFNGSYEAVYTGMGHEMKEIMLNFPLYNSVDFLDIGLEENARVSESRPYGDTPPVVFYGSSITQGGCASRPGNTYMSILSRKFGFDYINLGFSGNAHGEKAMRDYIAGLDMSCFVLDYDHNEVDAEDIKERHLPFYEAVRAAHPELPIIIMTAPDIEYRIDAFALKREIIINNYKMFRDRGDKVFFVDGRDMFDGEYRDCCTVDTCHPNDAGFCKMAEAVEVGFKFFGFNEQ